MHMDDFARLEVPAAVVELHSKRDASELSRLFAAGELSEGSQVWLFDKGWRTRGSELVHFGP